MSFEDNCNRFNIKPVNVCFNVTADVHNELVDLAGDNDMCLEDFMRCVVDWFLLNCCTD